MQLSPENAKASLKSYSLSVLMLMAYMSVLQSQIKMIASNHYADKQRLSSTCQFSQYNSCICWALWFHTVLFISSILSETLPVSNTPLLWRKQQLKHIKRMWGSMIFSHSFLTCFFCLFWLLSQTQLWTVSCLLWWYWKALICKAFIYTCLLHQNQVARTYLHLSVSPIWTW